MREHLAVIEEVKGPIVDLGSGNARYCRDLVELMRITHYQNRDFYLFDWYQERPIGSAIDFCNYIDNTLGKTGFIVKGDLNDTVPSELPDNIALLHMDLRGTNLTIPMYRQSISNVANHGLLVVTHGGIQGVKKDFELFAREMISEKIATKFVEKKDSSYIIRRNLKVIDNGKTRRQGRPEHLR